MDKHERSHSEKQIKIAILTMIGGIIAFCITQFVAIRNENCQRENLRQQTIMSAMLDDRLVIYKDACKAAGKIVADAEVDSPELPKSINDFDTIYFGEMALIDDKLIVSSAQDFRLACDYYLGSKKTINDKKALRDVAVTFTGICRETSISNRNKLIINDTLWGQPNTPRH